MQIELTAYHPLPVFEHGWVNEVRVAMQEPYTLRVWVELRGFLRHGDYTFPFVVATPYGQAGKAKGEVMARGTTRYSIIKDEGKVELEDFFPLPVDDDAEEIQMVSMSQLLGRGIWRVDVTPFYISLVGERCSFSFLRQAIESLELPYSASDKQGVIIPQRAFESASHMSYYDNDRITLTVGRDNATFVFDKLLLRVEGKVKGRVNQGTVTLPLWVWKEITKVMRETSNSCDDSKRLLQVTDGALIVHGHAYYPDIAVAVYEVETALTVTPDEEHYVQ